MNLNEYLSEVIGTHFEKGLIDILEDSPIAPEFFIDLGHLLADLLMAFPVTSLTLDVTIVYAFALAALLAVCFSDILETMTAKLKPWHVGVWCMCTRCAMPLLIHNHPFSNTYCLSFSLGNIVSGLTSRTPLYERSKNSNDLFDDDEGPIPKQKRRNTARVKSRKPSRKDRHKMLAKFNRDPGIHVLLTTFHTYGGS